MTEKADARLLALLQRRLFVACGGVPEAARAADVSDKLLYRCQDPTSEDNLSLARVLFLERFCGDPVLTRGMAEAAQPGAGQIIELRGAAVGGVIAATEVMREVEEAIADGKVTPIERGRIHSKALVAQDAQRAVVAAADAESA